MFAAGDMWPTFDGSRLSHRHDQKQKSDEDGQQFCCAFPGGQADGDHVFVRHLVLYSRTRVRAVGKSRLDLDQTATIVRLSMGGLHPNVFEGCKMVRPHRGGDRVAGISTAMAQSADIDVVHEPRHFP
ncbi:hypothetical protein N185_33285 [Sinorhizobium sp. GW3]|nr:hypothetical protein N185_33285 [Sinorhizobium sp. GW3]